MNNVKDILVATSSKETRPSTHNIDLFEELEIKGLIKISYVSYVIGNFYRITEKGLEHLQALNGAD